MSRGDERRLAEWVGCHCQLGFDEFHVVLDNPPDESERVLRELDVPATITVETRGPVGDYYDGVPADQRAQLDARWMEEHAAEVEASGMPTCDALSWRQ
ncbi:glycosyltransferase family 2 protein [Terrabacter aeriphilus]